jgi:2-keto-myo-inositol isomerase
MKLAVNQATFMKTPMESFLNAIAKAGFQGVELRRDETFQYLKNHSIGDLKRTLERNNLECITFNAVELFSLCPESEFEKILKYTEKLMMIGNKIGCDTIITVPSFVDDPYMNNEIIVSKTISRLNILAKMAEKFDFKLSFEPLGFPSSSVRKIDMALSIIEHKDLPEIGLVIDTFHFFIAEHSIMELDKIRPDKIWLIHINDAIEKPFKELEDSHRILPCRGFFNLEIFINKLRQIGYSSWISLELFNKELWKEDPEDLAVKSMDSLNKLIN